MFRFLDKYNYFFFVFFFFFLIIFLAVFAFFAMLLEISFKY